MTEEEKERADLFNQAAELQRKKKMMADEYSRTMGETTIPVGRNVYADAVLKRVFCAALFAFIVLTALYLATR